MCYVMGYVQYCYVFVSDGVADDVCCHCRCRGIYGAALESKTNFPEWDNKVYRIVSCRIVSYLRCYVYSCGITCVAYFTRPLYIEEF